jgi:hypothetical protein
LQGVAGFGSAWNIAHFTKLHVAGDKLVFLEPSI